MKKYYESPIMLAEVYQTNSYCGSCNKVLGAQLVTDKDHAYSGYDYFGNLVAWSPKSGYTITSDDLTHTFPVNPDPNLTSDGHCDGTHKDISQSIWKCDCNHADGSVWFLEWSHYYSMHLNNGASTFFLYKDNGDKDFDIIGSANSFPHKDPGSDTNVALVQYSYNELTVVNS